MNRLACLRGAFVIVKNQSDKLSFNFKRLLIMDMSYIKKRSPLGYVLLAAIALSSCQGKAENGKSAEAHETVVEQVEDTSRLAQAATVSVIADTGAGEVDTLKVYNLSEVDTPPLIDDAELSKQVSQLMKYPDMEPINGRGTAILTVERDGTVSAVEITQSIHPLLDKEYERVGLLLTEFNL